MVKSYKSAIPVPFEDKEYVVSRLTAPFVDKENVPVVSKVPLPFPVLGSVTAVDRFSDSSDMEMDSSPEVTKSEWRVPPLGQHKPEAVDVFCAEEFSEVSWCLIYEHSLVKKSDNVLFCCLGKSFLCCRFCARAIFIRDFFLP